MIPKSAIEKAIEGGWKLIAVPKRGIIKGLCYLKALYRGIKENVLLRLEVARVVASLTAEYPAHSHTTSTSATATDGILKSSDVYSAIAKLNSDYGLLNLSGLANELGITKEGVQRLIWLCADARDTNSGSGTYSAETISLVKNALYAERILKQTTSLSVSAPSWTKNELLPTRAQYPALGYGIQKMAVPSVVNAIAI